MGKLRVAPLIAAIIVALLPSNECKAAEGPGKPIRVLLVTGGHDHDHAKLLGIFKGAGDIVVKDAIHDKDPARDAAREYAPERIKEHEVIVLYDLWQDITEEGKNDLAGALAAGKGLVVLHHAMANYQKWPEYRKIMGGRFFLAPLEEGGVDNPQSTAVGGQKVKVKVEDRDHPVTKGLEDFELLDEPYGKYAVEPGVKTLLTTEHPASARQIGWCHAYGKARVVTLQPGHDDNVYRHPAYRKLIAGAIRWAAGRIPEAGPAGAPAGPKVGEVRPGHPRLILDDAGLASLKALIARDPGAAKLSSSLAKSAERLLGAPTVEHRLEGPRLLSQSRRCLQRVYLLSLFFRLDGDRRWRDRALKEIGAAADFPDWNPSHFLDTAEMTHALAIGYDWLHGTLSDGEKGTIRTAIVEKGLKPSLRFYREKGWWVKARHNWNQVCNGGIGIGALAIADEEPELARLILESALESIRLPMAEYGPDGAWSEGPGYWDYATRYNVYFIAALETALGSDFGLLAIPGFSRAGDFRLHFCGPAGRTFNFADAGSGSGNSACMFWLAKRFDRPIWAWLEREQVRGGDALDLAWWDPRGEGPRKEGVPTCARFRGAEVAFLRSAWEDRDAVFVGFKGGDNRANHSHLDLGTFVLDALGERWAHDLGGDDYNLSGYFGGKRWTYYRLRSEGHNIVTLDGENQDPKATAAIVGLGDAAAFRFAVADLTRAYPRKMRRHLRGIAIAGGKSILVVDEVETEGSETLRWTLQAPREIAIDGARAEIAMGKARLAVKVLEPAGARLEIAGASGPPPERQEPDLRRLLFRVPAEAGKAVRIAVLLAPHREGEPAADLPGAVRPLDEWGR